MSRLLLLEHGQVTRVARGQCGPVANVSTRLACRSGSLTDLLLSVMAAVMDDERPQRHHSSIEFMVSLSAFHDGSRETAGAHQRICWDARRLAARNASRRAPKPTNAVGARFCQLHLGGIPCSRVTRRPSSKRSNRAPPALTAPMASDRP